MFSHYGIDPRKSADAPYAMTNANRYHYQQKYTSQQHRSFSTNSNNNNNERSHSQAVRQIAYADAGSSTSNVERMNRLFDGFIANLENESFSGSLEKTTKSIFNASSATVWIKDQNGTKLYAPTSGKLSKIQNGILGVVVSKKNIINVLRPSNHPNFDMYTDSVSAPSLYIPILDNNEFFGAIVVCAPISNSNTTSSNSTNNSANNGSANSSNNGFSEADEKIAEKLMEKLSKYSHFFSLFFSDLLNKAIIDISSSVNSSRILISDIEHKLAKILNTRTVEFWATDVFNTSFLKFNNLSGQFEPVSKKAGVVSFALSKNQSTNIANVLKHPDYHAEFDGHCAESVLIEPMVVDGDSYALVFRRTTPSFSVHDEMVAAQILPLIAKALSISCNGFSGNNGFSGSSNNNNSNNNNNNNNNTSNCNNSNENSDNGGNNNGANGPGLNFNADFAERLKALLEVAEIISGVLDIEMLIHTIMERSCSLLNTERCSLFLVDNAKKELVTRFHGGLKKSIRLPIGRGIVGHTATSGNIVNIADAYSDPRFDKHVDLATGFRTKTLLTVPIYNNRGEIAGVTEMINKLDGGAFDEDDIKMMMAFNVFCGISLDNAKLYQTSLELTRQLRGFVEMSTALNKTKKIHNVLEEILTSAKDVINATRATIFMQEKDTNDAIDNLLPFVNIGASLHHGTIFADEIMEIREPKIFSRQEIFFKIQTSSDLPIDGLVGSASNSALSSTKSLSRVTSVLIKDDTDNQSTVDSTLSAENICGIPMISQDQKVIGVMELSCSGKILNEDLKLLDCFAVFATVSLERSELQEIADLGHIEVEMKQYLTPEERKGFDIPMKMRIEKNHMENLFKISFDAVFWDGVGHFKVLWAIADTFDLLREFKIPNEKWFRFILEISQTYKKVPYHNWRHAVDVTQFVTYQIKLTQLEKRLSKFELLGFVVAAICHDANHDGFTNAFNEKAETPLGILYKNQSVMETHHCTVAISVISKEECNLFSELDSTSFKNMWNLIVQLILITDMAKHFDFLKTVNNDMDKGKYDETDPESRLKIMQCILKCADISNVSRPFELADKWCDVLCEEFFRQGDLEMASGMEYTSPLNDREHLDKPKSQIGFYTFVCLPLYQAGARIFTELSANVEQVQSNLKVWKEACG